jgi:hypothetical protein
MVSPFLIRGILMGEISKMGWLMGDLWADSFYFLHLLLLSIPQILASSEGEGFQPFAHASTFQCAVESVVP